jgi:hypothetical protein
MKAKNYRIGNYIKFGELQHQMTYHDIRNLYESELVNKVPSGSYSDIALTKDWIEKLGGKTFGGVTYISIPNLKAELHFEFYSSEIIITIKSQFCELILDPIKYVHQLQNLFFALATYELYLET